MRANIQTYIGFFWSPDEDEHKVKEVLSAFPTVDFKRFSKHNIKPPTYIKTNEFTMPFQEVINTYGIPMYKEVNPAIFACVSFPFLFGVMFGDMGHGTLMFLFACFLVFFAEPLKRTVLGPFVMIRYFLLLMGLFAIYNGLIYNEIFSMPVDIFGSCYTAQNYTYNSTDPTSDAGYHRIATDCVYDVGVDPRWAQSTNYLTFANSLKMKIAVILGVFQMSLGISMKAFNSVYFSKWLDFFFEFIPQIIMLNVLFGWMDILIIAKWVYPFQLDWTSPTEYD